MESPTAFAKELAALRQTPGCGREIVFPNGAARRHIIAGHAPNCDDCFALLCQAIERAAQKRIMRERRRVK